MLTLLLLLAAPASEPLSPDLLAARRATWADEATRLIVSRWDRRPTGEDMARAYPRSALPTRRTALILVQCRIAPTGATENCEPLMSGPPGFKFAEAAVSVARKFKLKSPTEAQIGKTVHIPVKFNVANPSGPPPADYNPFGSTRCFAAFYSAADRASDLALSPTAAYFAQGVVNSLAYEGFSREEQLQWLNENGARVEPTPETAPTVRSACLSAYPEAPPPLPPP